MSGERPLAMAEQWMWLLEQLKLGGSALHLAAATEIRGPLDVDLLQQTVRAVANRHESLRTSFHDADGVPFARVHDEAVPQWERVDVSGFDDAMLWADALISRAFDLGRAETLRIGVARLEPDRHLVVLVVHHIVADGLSIGVLYDDVAAAYAALRNGDWTPDPAPMTYGDHVEYERSQAAGGRWAKNVEYWRATLDGMPPELGVKTDRGQTEQRHRRSYTAAATLARDTLAEVRACARRSHVSTTMVLVAAWAATLYRHGGGPDLVIGMPFSGRDRPETQRLVGLFMNVLPIRVRVAGEEPFTLLLNRVRSALLGALQNRQVPFTRLVAELQPERSLAMFFQTMLNCMTDVPLRLAGLETRSVPIDLPFIETDLTLTALGSEDQHAMRFALKCDSDLFDEPAAARWLSRFQTLLTAAVADPARPVDRLPLIDRAERELLETFATSPTSQPADSGVVELVEATVRRSPEAIAVRAGATTLTYAELDALAERLAGWFRASGTKPGTVVALHLDRSWQMLAAMLGVWKAGAAYLPLDPTYPRQRIEYMLNDANACLIVTDETDRFVELTLPGVPLLRIGEIIPAPAPDGTGVEHRRAGPDDLAYLVYTSGSTGIPKGVVVPHRAVVNFLASMSRSPGCGPEDVVLALTSPSFDPAVLELFLPLVVGATVVIASWEDAVDPHRLAALIDSVAVTIVQATPVTWKQLFATGEEMRLRLALCGGEQLTRTLADQLLAVADQAWNMYGPTETTVWSFIAPLAQCDGETVPIGRPIENITAWVLDEHLQPCPIGVPGELCIGGAGVTLGYHGLPAMTRERFVVGPRGECVYRSGDLARVLESGEFVMMGRRDNQVKVNGHRIELDEISTLLRRHPAVADAVTMVRYDDPDRPRLVSYVVARR